MEGGGVTLDLNQERYKLNKKERRLALQTLYNKKKNILIIENLENEIRTKNKTFKGL
jgi:ribosomal protein L4